MNGPMGTETIAWTQTIAGLLIASPTQGRGVLPMLQPGTKHPCQANQQPRRCAVWPAEDTRGLVS